jgi:hypothetical protein
LLAFLEIVENRFEIIRVDDEGDEKEKEAIAQWEKNHEQKPLPKKISLPIVIFRAPTVKELFVEEMHGIYGFLNKYQSKDKSERLIITNNYTREGIENALSKFHEVSREEYKKIFNDFGAPEKPEDAYGLKES